MSEKELEKQIKRNIRSLQYISNFPETDDVATEELFIEGNKLMADYAEVDEKDKFIKEYEQLSKSFIEDSPVYKNLKDAEAKFKADIEAGKKVDISKACSEEFEAYKEWTNSLDADFEPYPKTQALAEQRDVAANIVKLSSEYAANAEIGDNKEQDKHAGKQEGKKLASDGADVHSIIDEADKVEATLKRYQYTISQTQANIAKIAHNTPNGALQDSIMAIHTAGKLLEAEAGEHIEQTMEGYMEKIKTAAAPSQETEKTQTQAKSKGVDHLSANTTAAQQIKDAEKLVTDSGVDLSDVTVDTHEVGGDTKEIGKKVLGKEVSGGEKPDSKVEVATLLPTKKAEQEKSTGRGI